MSSATPKTQKGKNHFILQISKISSSFTCRYCLYIHYIKNSIRNYLTLASYVQHIFYRIKGCVH